MTETEADFVETLRARFHCRPGAWASVSPTVAVFARRVNDTILYERVRDAVLVPLVPAILASRAPLAVEVQRALLAADFAVRVFAPVALDARGRADDAAALRALPPIVDLTSAASARDACREMAGTQAIEVAAGAAGSARGAAYMMASAIAEDVRPYGGAGAAFARYSAASAAVSAAEGAFVAYTMAEARAPAAASIAAADCISAMCAVQ